MIIGDLAFLEGDEILIVERVRRLAPDHGHIALVELDSDRSGDVLLALVNQGLEHFALGREPEAIVDQLRIFGHQLVLEMSRAAIQCDGFNAAMRLQQDGAAGRLVDAARFHADIAVLDEVEAADAICLAKFVQLGEQGRR